MPLVWSYLGASPVQLDGVEKAYADEETLVAFTTYDHVGLQRFFFPLCLGKNPFFFFLFSMNFSRATTLRTFFK